MNDKTLIQDRIIASLFSVQFALPSFMIRRGRYSIVKIQQYSKNIYLTILHTEETEGNNKTVFCICLKE